MTSRLEEVERIIDEEYCTAEDIMEGCLLSTIGEGYEDYYGEDKEEQIEGMINNENVQKTGMNQMTIDAIKNMVKAKKK